MRVLDKERTGRGALRASGKAVWTWPPVVAVDAGAMQIQSWEGAALSGAETVLQGTTHESVRAEIGYGEKVSQRRWSKKSSFGASQKLRQQRLGHADGSPVTDDLCARD